MDSNTMNTNIFETLAISSESETEQPACTPASHSSHVSEEPKDSDQDQETKEVSITSFQGRNVVPLRKLDDGDYPALGVTSTPKTKKTKKTKKNKPDVIRFVVGSSYEETRPNRRCNQNFTNGDDPRSRAFTKMEDKETVAKTLTCTRACNNVKRDSPDKEFGVCHRENCSFAHCLGELNDPMCGFDSTCRFRWGKPQRDGTVNAKAKCMFRHSDETREDWIKRTGRTLPDLPETDEKTRKPTARKNTETKVQDKTPVNPVKSAPAPCAPLKTTKNMFTFTVPAETRSGTPIPGVVHKTRVSQWNVKPVQKPVARKKLDFSGDSDDSQRSRRSHYRHLSYSRKSRSRSPRGSDRKSSSPLQVIIVPNKELAVIAIKAVFDLGVYNSQVVIA
jgi:hypothetical protein